MPLLRFCTGAQIIFYGHFPDFHLAQHSSGLRRAYRAPFDALEISTTGAADRLLVNSLFTKTVYSRAFGAVADHADVLYPCVTVPSDNELQRGQAQRETGAELGPANAMQGRCWSLLYIVSVKHCSVLCWLARC